MDHHVWSDFRLDQPVLNAFCARPELRSGEQNGQHLVRPESDVTAPAARKFCSRERHWCMIDFMMKEHYKCIIWVTRALPTYTYTHHMGVQVTLGWYCGSHAHAPERFHFDMKVLMKKRFDFLTERTFFFSVYFCILTTEYGSCSEQLPHAPFKIEKYSLEVRQLEDGLLCYF